MKKLTFVFILIFVLAFLCACSNNSAVDVLPEENEDFIAETEDFYDSVTEEEYVFSANEMGYSSEMLEAIKKAGTSRKAVLNPLENAPLIGNEYSTENGEYSLGWFDLNGKADGLRFCYVKNGEDIRIVSFYAEYFECSIMDNEHFYCYAPEKGVAIYSFEHMKAVYEWIFPTASDKKYWNRGFAHCIDVEGHNAIMLFGITTGDNFSISNPSEKDVSAEYTIALVDIGTGLSTEIKTKIPVHFENGEPAFVYFDDGDLHEIKADFTFRICDRCYSVDFKTLDVKLEHDHDFEEENFRFPKAPLEFDISSADPILLKYYEYFGFELGYLCDYTKEAGFAPKAAAMYLFDKYAEHSGDKIGVPKDKFVDFSKKHFGFSVLEKTNFYVDDGTGFVVAAEGYSPSPSAFVLKERKINSDGSVTAVFYHIGLDYYEEGFYKNILRGASTDELLLSGQFGYFSKTIGLKEYTFFERTDENGGFYAEFVSAKILEPISMEEIYPVYGE